MTKTGLKSNIAVGILFIKNWLEGNLCSELCSLAVGEHNHDS